MNPGPLRIPLGEVSSHGGRGDESHIESVGEHGDRRDCADARESTRERGPRLAVQQECEDARLVGEFAVYCDRSLRECAETGIDWATARPDGGDGVSQLVMSVAVMR